MYRLILFAALLGISNCWGDDEYDHDWSDHDHNWPDHDHNWPDNDHDANDWSGHDHHDWPDFDHQDWPDHDHNHNDWPDHDGDCNHDKASPPGPDEWHSSHDRRFQKMSSYIIKADKYAQKFCNRYTNVDIQEVLGITQYQITYTLPQCSPENVNVKIGHRVLYMYARKTPTDDSDKFFDMRILPAMLKTADATWMCDGNKLTVVIPHDGAIKTKVEREKTCLAVDDNVITVAELPFTYRFGK